MKPKLDICIIGSADSPHTHARSAVFAKRGHRVCVVSRKGNAPIPGIEVISINSPHRSTLMNIFMTFFHTGPLLRQSKYDVIHSHQASSLSAWILALFRYDHLIISLMGSDILGQDAIHEIESYQKIITEVLKSSRLITGQSKYILEHSANYGDFQGKLHQIHWGLDLELFQAREEKHLRTELGLDEADQIIFCPKILRSLYNIHLILDAMPAVLADYPRAKLLLTRFFSDKPYHTQLMDQINKLGLGDHVIFLERIEHHQMPAYYAIADVVISIPSSDNMPRTLLEGLACKTPNIIGNLSTYQEVVTHLESAYLVEFSAESIAEGIKHLLADPALRKTIIENGYQRVQVFGSFDQQASDMENLYYQVAETPRKSLGLNLRLLRYLLSFFAILFVRKIGKTLAR